MFEESDDYQKGGYWPSVSDLFMTLFIISLVLIGSLYYIMIPKHRPGDDRFHHQAVGIDMRNIRRPVNAMRRELEREELRGTQTPKEVVDGLRTTSDEVVEKLAELKEITGANGRDIREPVNAMRRALGREELRDTLTTREVVGGLRSTSDEVVEKLTELKTRISSLETENSELKDATRVKELEKKIQELTEALNDKPPIIKIDEATKEYRFSSGSAEMSDAFRGGLNKQEFVILADEILKRNGGSVPGVDTLEIVGHTDGQAVRASGNLDAVLPEFLSGRERGLKRLRAGSNNDLGLLRALAVKRAWEEFVGGHPSREVLQAVAVRSYSAGQTIPAVDEGLSQPETYRQEQEKSRRIEIRLTKLGDRQ